MGRELRVVRVLGLPLVRFGFADDLVGPIADERLDRLDIGELEPVFLADLEGRIGEGMIEMARGIRLQGDVEHFPGAAKALRAY